MNATLNRILAPITDLLADPTIDEILIDRHNRVFFDRGDAITQADSPFKGPNDYRAMVRDLFHELGVSIDDDHPIAEGRLPDHTRVLAVMPPVATGDEPHFVLRRVRNYQLTWDDIFRFGSATPDLRDLLADATAARQNILIAGGTGSGKTTLTNLMAGLIPETERTIIVEPIYEIDVDLPRSLHLTADPQRDISFDDVLLTASKMRPDRLIVGGLRGGEALRALQLLASGHDGSFVTIHATSTEDALARLESFCLMANAGLGLAEIRTLIGSALRVVVNLNRLPDGKRRITAIDALTGLDDHRYVLQPLARHDPQTDTFTLTGNVFWA